MEELFCKMMTIEDMVLLIQKVAQDVICVNGSNPNPSGSELDKFIYETTGRALLAAIKLWEVDIEQEDEEDGLISLFMSASHIARDKIEEMYVRGLSYEEPRH